MKVLFVDDDPVLRHLASYALGTIGNMTVDIAVDGADALAAVDASPPDVIVLDFMMPTMNGDAVLAVLQSSPATREIPVIFLTGLGGEAQQEAALLPGAVACISKPFDPSSLAKSVTAIVESLELTPPLGS